MCVKREEGKKCGKQRVFFSANKEEGERGAKRPPSGEKHDAGAGLCDRQGCKTSSYPPARATFNFVSVVHHSVTIFIHFLCMLGISLTY